MTEPTAPHGVGEHEVHEVQALVEGVVLGDRRITFLGGSYRVADKVGLMPLMKFAHAASSGLDTADMEALGAIYEMLRDCIHPEDWARFEADAIVKKAEAEDLLPVVQQTIEVINARPTQPPSGSSNGRPPESASSTGSSSSPALAASPG